MYATQVTLGQESSKDWSKLVHVGYLKSNIKGQVQSPVKVCEVSEVATNIKLYEI